MRNEKIDNYALTITNLILVVSSLTVENHRSYNVLKGLVFVLTTHIHPGLELLESEKR